MNRTIELSETLTVTPEGLEFAVTPQRSCLVTGAGYNSYYREHFFTLDLISVMRNDYPITKSEIRQAKAKGWALGAALLGLLCCMIRMGWLCYSNM